MVAATRPRIQRPAARPGDGWVATGSQTARAGNGRSPGEVDRFPDPDSSPVYSMSSVDAFVDAVGRARELGFTDVVAHWPRASGWYAGDEKVLETVAARPTRPRVRRCLFQWPCAAR